MADKYLYLDTATGRSKERALTVVSAGAGDSGKGVALGGAGRLDNSVMPVGVGADTATINASENLSAGDLVNIWNSTGPKARKADATASGKEAVGFVLASVTSGNDAEVYFSGSITGLSSLTPGDRYYLSAATPGAATSTPPAGSGNVVQFLGLATSTTTINFEPTDGVILV